MFHEVSKWPGGELFLHIFNCQNLSFLWKCSLVSYSVGSNLSLSLRGITKRDVLGGGDLA